MRAVGGKGYQEAAGLVLPLGIAMALMSFSNDLLLYRLSTGRLRFWARCPPDPAGSRGARAVPRLAVEFAWTVTAMNGVFLGGRGRRGVRL